MAQAVIGALRVNLGIDSAAFSNGLKKSETGLQKFGRMAKKGLLAAGAAASGAAVGMAVMVRNTLNTADQLAKTSDKIGIAVEDLQRLRHAADLSGVSTNTLDMAMQRFSRRVGEAAQGGGELKSTLEQYGIAVRDSEGNIRSQVDILRDLSEVIKNAGSDQERLRIAFKAFDSEGAALVNTLKGGAAGLNEMMREADELGIVISEKTARSAEQFNDNLTRLRGTFTAVGNTIAADLAPYLLQISEWLVENAPQIREWASVIAQQLIKAGQDIAKLAAEIKFYIDLFRRLRDDAGANLDAFRDKVSTVTNEIVAIFRAIPGQMAEIGRQIISGLWDGIKGQWESVKGSVTGIASGIKDRFTNFFQIRSPSRVMMDVGRNIIQGLGDGMLAVGNDIGTIAQSIGSTIGSAFQGVIQGSKSVKDALKEVLASLASMLANQAFQALLGGVIGGGGFLGGLLGALLPGFANGGSFSVGGSGGVDSQIVAFRATPGEMVNIQKPGTDRGNALDIKVGVAADNNGNLMPFVESVSRREAARATGELARSVPRMVDQRVDTRQTRKTRA